MAAPRVYTPLGCTAVPLAHCSSRRSSEVSPSSPGGRSVVQYDEAMGAIFVKGGDGRTKELDKMGQDDHASQTKKLRMLLLGTGESGKSTLFKQLKVLYGQQYTAEDRKLFTAIIASNVIGWMMVLGDAVDKLGTPLSTPAAIKAMSNVRGACRDLKSVSPELAADLKLLWEETVIKDAFKLRAQFHVSESAEYFFNKMADLGEPAYSPSNMDALRFRAPTTGIVETEFSLDNAVFQMLDVGGQRNERKKWIHCFEGVTTVIFVASLSEYDQMMYEDLEKNRMIETLELFQEVCRMPWFLNTPIILFLNKSDLFKEKIKRIPLNKLFPEYEGGDDYEAACSFVAAKFLGIQAEMPEKVIYEYVTCATDTDAIVKVFNTVKDILVRKHLKTFM